MRLFSTLLTCGLLAQVPIASAQTAPVIVTTFDGTSALLGTGSSPGVGGVIKGSDGALFGVTQDSILTRCGVVYRVVNSTVTVLHEFAGSPTDGCVPVGELVEATDGYLYGATLRGGAHNGLPLSSGAGTIFRIHKDGSGYSVVHDFGPAPYVEGAAPQGGLTVGKDMNLYGTTSYGGAAGGTCLANAGLAGTFYQLTALGAFSVKHDFRPETDGCAPIGNLTLAADGSFLGATYFGGYSATEAFAGTVFRVTSAGAFTPLFMFPGSPGSGYPYGANPTGAPTEGSDGSLYGVASGGGVGPNATGTIYQLALAGTTWTGANLHTFTGPDGAYPWGRLTAGADGNYYGVTSSGGEFSAGTLFQLTPAGTHTPFYSFAGPADGCCPAADLLQATPGLFYGLVSGPGASQGAIFSFTVGSATTTTLSSSLAASVFGQAVSLTAAVSSASGTPTGQVEFLDGNTPLGTSALSGGTASRSTTTLNVGSHTLVASYPGDGAFLPSSSATVAVTVSKAQTATTLRSSPNPSKRKQAVTLTASVSPAAPGAGVATGQVQFFEGKGRLGTAPLVNGVASLQIAFAPTGQHVIRARFAGDANFIGSDAAPLTQTVTK